MDMANALGHVRTLSRLTRDVLYHTGIVSLYPSRRETGTLTVVAYRRILPRHHEQRLASARDDVIDPDQFRRSLDVLQEMYTPISLPQLLGYLDAGRPMPPRGALITFDDGWIDSLTEAAPELKRRKLPAVVFVPPAIFGRRGPFWQGRFAYAVRIGSISRMQLRSLAAAAQLNEAEMPAGREAAIAWFLKKLGGLAEEVRDDALNRTIGALPGDGTRHFVAPSDMRRFWDYGIVVGYQGLTQEALNTVGQAHQILVENRERLTHIAGQNIVCMSLPHGGCSKTMARQARAAGFKVIFTDDAVINSLPRPETGEALLGRIRIHPGGGKGSLAHRLLYAEVKTLRAVGLAGPSPADALSRS